MRNVSMRNVIVGTAGHIDHGKTALIRALTGIDTDRLEEEKRRGISIDLGFANLDLEQNIRLGFIDVPGHERFIKNMLAGVGGIDVVLFVIAADESIQPQTREHFDICRLLRIPSGIVVLTKADKVDADILGLVRLEAEEFVRGSFLDAAPIIATSAATRQGLDDLKAALAIQARQVAAKDVTRWFRMPVDRAFTMKGFGTVVTGTVRSGKVALEEELELYPTGRCVRVRGAQVHGQSVIEAQAGQRTAINLADVDVQSIARGMTLAPAGRLRATQAIDTRFELLPGAKPLKQGAPVHFHSGTAEIEAEVRLLDGPYLRLLLREPLLLLPGDRFIVRKFSPVITIGGGEVIDIEVPKRIRRAVASERLDRLTRDRVATLVAESDYGLSANDVVARTGLMPREIDQTKFFTIREPQLYLIDHKWVEAKSLGMLAALKAYHKQHPLAPGMPKEELRAQEFPGAPPFVMDAILPTIQAVVIEAAVVRLKTHRIAFREDEEAALTKIETAFSSAGLSVPALSEVLAKCGIEPARARTLLQLLLKGRKLVKIGDDLVFHHSALTTLRELLGTHKGQRFSVPEFKEWTNVSRKYAIPLLEYLDKERVTRREGDTRLVL